MHRMKENRTQMFSIIENRMFSIDFNPQITRMNQSVNKSKIIYPNYNFLSNYQKKKKKKYFVS